MSLRMQMTVCTKQSIQLHRESVDNLHTVVDTNIKVGIIGCMNMAWELLVQRFAGWLRDYCRVAQANLIDHSTVLFSSLETELRTSVVINSICSPPTYL